jgi:iron complex outermembrane recepter protein
MVPYDLTGNVVSATPGGQIDPALSALVGHPVTIAGVPPGLGGRPPTLGDFVGTAGTPNVTDVGDDRSLAPATQTLTANGVLTHPLGNGVVATVNATVSFSRSDSLQGLPGIGLDVPAGDPFSPFSQPVVVDRYVDRPLNQYIDGWTAHLGSTVNKDFGPWRLSLTDAFDHADTETDTDAGIDRTQINNLLAARSPTLNPFGPLPAALLPSLPQDYARSITDSANMQVLANGPLFKLPAGDFYVSGEAGDTQSWQGGYSTRMAEAQATWLTRNDISGRLNLDLPVTSRRKHFLPIFGELSLNANLAIDQLSDVGPLKAFGYGVNWTPIPGYNIIFSHTNDQAAPTVQQLAGPVVYTPGVPVLDYATGQTVDVTQVSGGNPLLKHDNRNVTKIGLTFKPIPNQDFTFTANYIKSDIDNPIATFPAATGAIEMAFPTRFIRDDEGVLVEEDIRSVNFARSERTELRWGLNYSRPLGKQPKRPDFQNFRRPRPGGSGGANGPEGGPPSGPGGDNDRGSGGGGGGGSGGGGGFGGGGGGRGGFGGGGRGGFGRFGGGPPTGGRLQVAVYHTIYFTDRVLVAPGGPTLDLLSGAPASATGGQYRNEIEGQLGATLNGFGARLSEDWRQGTHVVGLPGTPTENLDFSSVTTLNLRLWDDLGRQRAVVHRYPWLRGVRVTLAVTNLLDDRVSVRDGAGMTPLSYQPGYIDPVGRAITLSLRKLFY